MEEYSWLMIKMPKFQLLPGIETILYKLAESLMYQGLI